MRQVLRITLVLICLLIIGISLSISLGRFEQQTQPLDKQSIMGLHLGDSLTPEK